MFGKASLVLQEIEHAQGYETIGLRIHVNLVEIHGLPDLTEHIPKVIELAFIGMLH